MARKLNVYLHQNYAGDLVQDDSGQMSFTYAQTWLANPKAVKLSQSLPLRPEKFNHKQCQGFFSGILPEEQSRKTIARILGISSQNDFAMLERIGGECAGAVTFLPAGQKPAKTDYNYRALSNSQLAHILRTLSQHPLLAGEKGVRLSLAGVQNKVALMIKGDKAFVPLDGAPSSHILKPAIDRFEGLVYNEAFCLQLATSISISAAKASIQNIEDINYLLIERYDRLLDSNGNGQRIHQEDFCQALGIVSTMKYQNEGGPNLKQCFDLVRAVSSVPALDLKTLLDAVIFNYLIGNNDAHGKNFSLLYHENGRTELAPLYDIVCTGYCPELSTKMAMKIGGEYESRRIHLQHFERLAKEIGFGSPMVRERVTELAKEVLKVLNKLEYANSVVQEIIEIIRKRCEKIGS